MPDILNLPDEPTPEPVPDSDAPSVAAAAPELAEAAPAEPAESAPAAIPELSPAACAARLAELFPAVFAPGAAKPLKLRIQADIQLRAPATFTRKSLSIFLHRHTTSTAYLKALVGSLQRSDLDGQPAGDVADEHRVAAAAELERRRALHDDRRAAERDAQRKLHEAQRKAFEESRRQQNADEDARRERAALLRAFETSTLTRANFCALKRISEGELDALLAQARQDPPPERPAFTPPRAAPLQRTKPRR